MTTTYTILKSLVGSRAHGLHREDSDWDWRGVFVQRTSEILSLNYKTKATQWLEGDEDHVNYEIGHFLSLAQKANPSVLELLVSPQIETFPYGTVDLGKELIGLMPYMFDPQDAFNAFVGYSKNQRKKMFDDKDGRKLKHSLAYIRTLYSLNDLLETGTFSLKINTLERFDILTDIKNGLLTSGQIFDLASDLTSLAEEKLKHAENRKDEKKINDFLLKVREICW